MIPLAGKRRISTPVRIVLTCAMLMSAAFSAAVFAQSRPLPPPATPRPSPEDKENIDFSTRADEARTRLILKEEKKNYEEHVARAKEARQIASDLKAVYETRSVFSSEEQKKWERLEKLTRRIRNEAGGADSHADPRDLPASIDAAVKRVAEMADELCKEVEKTPRRVISTSIIDQANRLIGVIQFVRGANR
jgi:hypothetical protein